MKDVSGGVVGGLILLTCAGCAPTVSVTVTGTHSGAPIPSHVTYAVIPIAEVEKDPAFPKYADLVARHMDARDYKKTSDKTAHLGVFVSYATHGGSSKARARLGTGAIGAEGGMASGGGSGNVGGYGMMTGSAPAKTGPRLYTHQLVIVVADLKKSGSDGSVVELWRGETMHTDTSQDLAPFAPLMVEAAFRHFGDTTPADLRHLFTEEEAQGLQQVK